MTDVTTTPSQTVGPFLAIGLPWADGSDLVADGTPGALVIEGVVTDGDRVAVPDALIEIWQADPDGRFPHPGDPRGASTYAGFRNFGRCPTDATGRYWFRTLAPGPVDDEQAPHIDVLVFARGLVKQLVTRLYLPGATEGDPLLGELAEVERAKLIGVPTERGVRFDIRLQGDGETPFFAL